MFKTIGLMIVPPIILVIVATIIFVKVLSRGEQKYDVFMVEGNELVILAGIPVRYRINDIETVTFSNVLGKYGSFVGIMKIKKKDGIFGRSFRFDASAYHKKFVLSSTQEEIDLATENLMEQLRSYGVDCKKDWIYQW